MSNKASKDDLSQIHSLTAKVCLSILRDGEVVKDAEGNVRTLTPSASMLAVVTKFLKDNNITDDGLPPVSAGRDLAAEARALLNEEEQQGERAH